MVARSLTCESKMKAMVAKILLIQALVGFWIVAAVANSSGCATSQSQQRKELTICRPSFVGFEDTSFWDEAYVKWLDAGLEIECELVEETEWFVDFRQGDMTICDKPGWLGCTMSLGYMYETRVFYTEIDLDRIESEGISRREALIHESFHVMAFLFTALRGKRQHELFVKRGIWK